MNHLAWFPVKDRKSGPQGFMAPAYLCETLLQDVNSQFAFETKGHRDIVGPVPRRQLVDKPKSLLCECQGRVSSLRPRFERREGGSFLAADRMRQPVGQLGHCRLLKDQT